MDEKLILEKLEELEKRVLELEKLNKPVQTEQKSDSEEMQQVLKKTGENAKELAGASVKFFKKGLSGLGKQLSKLDEPKTDDNKI